MLLTGIDKPSVVALKSLERRVKPANAWKLLIVLSPKMLFPPLVPLRGSQKAKGKRQKY